MANLNLVGQEVSNKREREYTVANFVAKSYPL